ncbi:hypothetical protein DFH08DRAFT_1024873 [Mycena albidolilacea]|uniref:Uncharacterized protein n=1 Tax=Mycena albidolilacea TaxID=1033008 RepID=A0AAD7F151_9AGAR|nr:hypothetical protein DFH08DRAFT_1024873 [Mycena albidolilacea]
MLAATSSVPSHSKPTSATPQKNDAQPQRHLQHPQHWFPITCVAFIASPHAATFLMQHAHHTRESLPIPSVLFSASPHAATILAASGSKHSIIACAAPPICAPTAFSHRRRLSYPCRRNDPLRHPKLDTNHLCALRYYLHRRRLHNAQLRDPRKGSAAVINARSLRNAAGRYPALGACSHCGYGFNEQLRARAMAPCAHMKTAPHHRCPLKESLHNFSACTGRIRRTSRLFIRSSSSPGYSWPKNDAAGNHPRTHARFALAVHEVGQMEAGAAKPSFTTRSPHVYRTRPYWHTRVTHLPHTSYSACDQQQAGSPLLVYCASRAR